ncbi:MAG: AraC family transcriptional regulator [Bergeyella sp.]
MKIAVKNMVCNRCIAAVERIFKQSGVPVKNVILGEVETLKDISPEQLSEIEKKLKESGFAILENHSQKQIEKIKTGIVGKISELDIEENFRLSDFVSELLHKDYSALSKLFSQHENMTLEQYFILQKIEKAKELIIYNEFTLTEISQKLGYKSVQHLSNQFRKITGFSPTQFLQSKNRKRIGIDRV